MKRLFTIIISALLIFAPLSAFDWGGRLGNDSTIAKPGDSDLSFTQSNSLSLWMSAPLGEKMYFKAEGLYKYEFNTSTKKFINYADLNLLKLSGSFNSVDFSAGRFMISDLTGIIFSQNSDGAFLKFTKPRFNISLYAGFTGLLNSNIVTILGPGGKPYAPKNEIYSLHAPYIPVIATVSFPSLFANQTLSVQGLGFINVSQDNYHRVYGTIELSGGITSSIFYSVATSFGTENFKSLMNLTNLNVSIFPKDFIYLNVGIIYASGDHIGMKPFIGFTSSPVCVTAKSLETSSCLTPSISATISLIESKLLLNISGKGLFTFLPDKMDATGIQLGLNATYNIFTDFQVGLNGTWFKGFADSSLDKISATFTFAIIF